MQPEIHATEPPVPASDLLPPQRSKGIPKITAILGVGLLAAATFLAGIEAQKQWGGSSTNGRGNGFAARFAAGGTGTAAGTNGANGTNGAAGAQGGGAPGGFGGRGGFTTGTVKLVKGSTLYVTTTDGNVVRVSVPAATAVTKTVTTKLSALKPGDAVTAIGAAGSDGIIQAQRVSIGTAGAGGFGGGFGRRAGANGGNGGAQGANGTAPAAGG
jgi:hypothetical protein